MDTATADHDWRGRPYMMMVSERDPLEVHLTFWTDWPSKGPVPRPGDRIILRHEKQDHGACYTVTEVGKPLAEGDVHGLSARFYPRSQDQIVADVEKYGAVIRKPVVW